MSLWYLSVLGLLISILGVTAVAMEGGYKHFADNLKVLQENNGRYAALLRAQDAQIESLETNNQR